MIVSVSSSHIHLSVPFENVTFIDDNDDADTTDGVYLSLLWE